MIILNNNKKKKTINTKRFAELIEGYKKGYEVIRERKVKKLNEIEIPGKSAMILELRR